jgi:hypothetical protein
MNKTFGIYERRLQLLWRSPRWLFTNMSRFRWSWILLCMPLANLRPCPLFLDLLGLLALVPLLLDQEWAVKTALTMRFKIARLLISHFLWILETSLSISQLHSVTENFIIRGLP